MSGCPNSSPLPNATQTLLPTFGRINSVLALLGRRAEGQPLRLGVGSPRSCPDARTRGRDCSQEPPLLRLRRSWTARKGAKGGPSSSPKLTGQEAAPQKQQQWQQRR